MYILLECVDTYTSKSKTGSDGGAGQDGIDTLAKCKTACNADDECLGFDWTLDDSADTRCWLHNDEDKFEDNNSNDDSDQYTRVSCKGDAEFVFCRIIINYRSKIK